MTRMSIIKDLHDRKILPDRVMEIDGLGIKYLDPRIGLDFVELIAEAAASRWWIKNAGADIKGIYEDIRGGVTIEVSMNEADDPVEFRGESMLHAWHAAVVARQDR